SQALRVIDRIFVWEGLFRDVRRFNGECDSSIAQKLRPAWRSRGKDQRHGGPIVRINVRSPLGAKETSEMECEDEFRPLLNPQLVFDTRYPLVEVIHRPMSVSTRILRILTSALRSEKRALSPVLKSLMRALLLTKPAIDTNSPDSDRTVGKAAARNNCVVVISACMLTRFYAASA